MASRGTSVPLRGASVSTEAAGVHRLTHDVVRNLMKVARTLRHLGIETKDLPIPKICVVGDQSTGKSSVIESISGIHTPRKDGACTRCPFEINLVDAEEGAEWECHVFLNVKYNYSPRMSKNAPMGPTKNSPLGPWIPQEAETIDFATVHRKEDVLEVLRSAQLAVLNPGCSPNKFMPGSTGTVPTDHQVPFSPNVVRLDISAPSLPNLSFYDLPGVVSQDSDGEYVPTLITNLVREYIGPQNCIILQTLTMNYDAANSNAASIIKRSKAISRTVGVLTKPDLFVDGSLHEWKQILDGDKFRLERGYFVVKNDPDPSIPHDVARHDEQLFFRLKRPFNTELAHHSEKFGTFKLQHALSKMLAVEIERSLPTIIDKIQEKLKENEEKLSRLPKPLEGNLSLQIQHQIAAFEQVLIKELEGGSLDCVFFEQWHKAAKRFHNDVVCSYPLLKFGPPLLAPRACRVVPNNNTSPTPGTGTDGAIVVEDDDELPSTPKRMRVGNSQPGSRKRDCDAAPISTQMQPTFEEQLRKLEGAGDAQKQCKRFTLDEISTYLNKVHTGLPSARNQKIVGKMFRDSIEHWDIYIDQFLDITKSLCEVLAARCMKEALKQWQKVPLWTEVERIINDYHSEVLSTEYEAIRFMYGLEKSRVITFEDETMKQFEEEIKDVLRTQSRRVRQRAYFAQRGTSEDQVSKADIDHVRNSIEAQAEPFDLQIQEMKTVRAYYHVAARRFTDQVGLRLAGSLFARIKDGLPRALESRLGLDKEDANEQCKRLLEINPALAAERDKLQREQETLRKGQATLRALQRDHATLQSGNNGDAMDES